MADWSQFPLYFTAVGGGVFGLLGYLNGRKSNLFTRQSSIETNLTKRIADLETSARLEKEDLQKQVNQEKERNDKLEADLHAMRLLQLEDKALIRTLQQNGEAYKVMAETIATLEIDREHKEARIQALEAEAVNNEGEREYAKHIQELLEAENRFLRSHVKEGLNLEFHPPAALNGTGAQPARSDTGPEDKQEEEVNR